MTIPKILVTGANGFLGSHLISLFSKCGYIVYAYVRPTSDLARISPLPDNVFLTTEYSSCLDKVDCVVHTATNYGRGDTDISDIVASNILFPVQLFGVMLFFWCYIIF